MSTMVIPKPTEYALVPIWMIGALTTGLFLLDLSLPLGVAAGVPYLLVVLLSKDVPGRPSTVMIGIVCSGLTVAGYVFSPAGGEEWKVVANRSLALFAIWTTAVLTIRWKENAVELRHRAENIQAIVDLIPHMIYVRDPGGRFLMVNETTAEVFGVSKEELLESQSGFESANTCEELTRPQSDYNVLDQQPMQTEEEISVNVRGHQRWFRMTRVPFDIDSSSDIGVLTVALDQTEQRQVQQTLVLTKHVFDASADHISVLDTDYRYRRVNPAYEKAHGMSLEKIVGLHVADLLGDDLFQQIVKPKLDKCLAGDEVTYESWFRFKEQGQRYMVITYSPLHSNQDVVDGVIVVARDLTDRKEAELKRAQLEYAVNRAMEGLSLHDENGIFTYINPAEAAIYGYETHELLGKSWKEQYGAEQIAQIEDEVLPLLEEHGKWQGQLTGRKKTREFFDVEVSLTLLKSEDESPLGLLCTCRDITERKLAEDALQESEARLQAILDNSPGLIFLKDVEGRYLHVNRQFKHVFGLEETEVIGRADEQIFSGDQARQFNTHDRQVMEHKKLLEFEEVALHDDGPHTSIVQKFPLFNHKGEMFAVGGITTDITERKEAEKALEKSRQAYHDLVDAVEGIVWECDFPSYQFTFVNQQAERLLGYPVQRWISDPLFLADLMHEEDRDGALSYCKKASDEARNHELEYRVIAADGRVVWLRDLVTVVLEDDQPVKLRGIMFDITERKRMEDELRQYTSGLEAEVSKRTDRIKELEQRRMQVEKLAALAQVAAGVAHEINNPLASIAQSMLLLKRAIPTEHQNFHYAGKIDECIERISHIVKQLYQLYRPEPVTHEKVNAIDVVRGAIDIMQPSATKRNINIVSQLPALPVSAKISRVDFTQILCNLIHNALDASQPGQTVLLGITYGDGNVMISVHDDGSGIQSDDHAHIFEPFFTTKHGKPDGGMGLGLAVSRSLVESMGGTIEFTSCQGEGTTFRLRLPR